MLVMVGCSVEEKVTCFLAPFSPCIQCGANLGAGVCGGTAQGAGQLVCFELVTALATGGQNGKHCRCQKAQCKLSLQLTVRPIPGSDGNVLEMALGTRAPVCCDCCLEWLQQEVGEAAYVVHCSI